MNNSSFIEYTNDINFSSNNNILSLNIYPLIWRSFVNQTLPSLSIVDGYLPTKIPEIILNKYYDLIRNGLNSKMQNINNNSAFCLIEFYQFISPEYNNILLDIYSDLVEIINSKGIEWNKYGLLLALTYSIPYLFKYSEMDKIINILNILYHHLNKYENNFTKFGVITSLTYACKFIYDIYPNGSSNTQPKISCNIIISLLLSSLSKEIFPYINNPHIYSEKIKKWSNQFSEIENEQEFTTPQVDKSFIINQYILMLNYLYPIIYKLNNTVAIEIFEFLREFPSLLIDPNTPMEKEFNDEMKMTIDIVFNGIYYDLYIEKYIKEEEFELYINELYDKKSKDNNNILIISYFISKLGETNIIFKNNIVENITKEFLSDFNDGLINKNMIKNMLGIMNLLNINILFDISTFKSINLKSNKKSMKEKLNDYFKKQMENINDIKSPSTQSTLNIIFSLYSIIISSIRKESQNMILSIYLYFYY